MHIGLYFGSFNPIHIGHCIIASHIVQHSDLDSIWFVVSPQNPFKQSSALLNEYHRFHLAQLALEDNNKLKASDIEFQLPKPSYTIDTLAYLKEKYPEKTFSIIMGSDGFQNLDKWKNAHTLIKEHRFFVYKRPGFEIKNPLQANLQLADAPLLEISSTHIREMIKKGKSVRYLVPDKAREEIEKYNYYR